MANSTGLFYNLARERLGKVVAHEGWRKKIWWGKFGFGDCTTGVSSNSVTAAWVFPPLTTFSTWATGEAGTFEYFSRNVSSSFLSFFWSTWKIQEGQLASSWRLASHICSKNIFTHHYIRTLADRYPFIDIHRVLTTRKSDKVWKYMHIGKLISQSFLTGMNPIESHNMQGW